MLRYVCFVPCGLCIISLVQVEGIYRMSNIMTNFEKLKNYTDFDFKDQI